MSTIHALIAVTLSPLAVALLATGGDSAGGSGTEPGPGAAAEPVAAPPQLERMAFLAGEWTATYETYAETWGDEAAGSTPGVIRGRFGPLRSWFEMEAEMDLPGSGAYAVKVLVYEDGRSGGLRAFVVNSFNSGAAYTGGFESDDALVFQSRIGDKIQRVRYERRGARIHYFIDESRDDGATWEPHSESWWDRAAG